MLVADQRAIVIEIGSEAWADESEPRAKVGDRVMLAKYTGVMITGPGDGKQYRMVNDKDIFAQITEEHSEYGRLGSPIAPSVGAKPATNLALKGIES